MPHNQAAAVTGAGLPLSIISTPYPTPSATEILISVSAIALNPADWKLASASLSSFPLFNLSYPFVPGCDIAGTVISTGSSITNVVPGDRVLSQTNGTLPQNNARGGFQKFVLVPSPYFGKLPESVQGENAVVLPLGMCTAARGLFEGCRLGLALPPSVEGRGRTLLVWGGSSSVGVNATQLAVAAGYEVIAVASRHNFELCKSVGASLVFDYNDPSFISDLSSAMKGKDSVGAYDAIGSSETCGLICEVVEKSGTAKRITSVAPGIPEAWKREGWKITCFFPPSDEWEGIAEKLFAWVGRALQKGVLKMKPDSWVVGEGLESLQNGMEEGVKGYSGKKLVVTL